MVAVVFGIGLLELEAAAQVATHTGNATTLLHASRACSSRLLVGGAAAATADTFVAPSDWLWRECPLHLSASPSADTRAGRSKPLGLVPDDAA